jgi:hypothetical protein
MIELIKDTLYRHMGLFPPMPTSNLSLGELTPELAAKIDQLRTVCIFLGPNRNLTTLAASVLALHPNCQVMSHGGSRVLPEENLNFMNGYSEEKFRNFCHFLWVMSQNSDKGSFGGSITVTHAFRDYKTLHATFRRRYGRSLIKRDVKSLIWKEAHQTDDYVAEHKVDLGAVISKNDKLRFILPIRNMIDVTYSFYNREPFRRNFYKDQVENPDAKIILDDLLERMVRTVNLYREYPERVFLFFENEIGRDLFVRMEDFLLLPHDERWINDALKCFVVSPSKFEPIPGLMAYYVERVSALFAHAPEIRDKFLLFASSSG